MNTEARSAAEPFVHPALFYRDETEYLGHTVPFITDGLAVDEPVAVAVPGPQLTLLRAELGDTAARVHMLDMGVVGRNPGRIIPGVLRAFADQHTTRRVRIIGEPIWFGRSDTEYPACVQHEALINLAFTGREVSILCPYNTKELPPEVIEDAAMTHPVLIDDSGERESHDYAPVDVIGSYNRPLPVPPGSERQDFDASTLRPLRSWAAQHAQRLGMAEVRVDDLILALTEMATNSVEHGAGSGTMYLWTADGHLVCHVFDRGRLADPLVGRIPAPPDQPRGRGVLLVNYLADLVRMHTTPDGTTIQAHFAL